MEIRGVNIEIKFFFVAVPEPPKGYLKGAHIRERGGGTPL
jgi:hypothetical protein